MEESKKDLFNKIKLVVGEVSKTIVGKEDAKEALMIALLAGGHILIEGPPGTGKTKLADAFASAIGGTFKRVQLTPDLLPADITGFYMYAIQSEPRFVKGPLFANVVMADELNRTTPRTQSALLEAMAEEQVSIEGITHYLPQPFMVIATQVKTGSEGTYSLTDVQIDRFLLKVSSNYPAREEELRIINDIDYLDSTDLCVVIKPEDILALREEVKTVHVSKAISEYIIDIVDSLRKDPDNSFGPSPRGAISLFKCARAKAKIDGRDYVIPDDVKQIAGMTLGHRIVIRPEAEMDGITADAVVERVVSSIRVPKVEA